MPAQQKTILLVEDEVVTARRETHQLENQGYKVILTPCGEEAIDIVCVRKLNIDLILMDIDLGDGIDGTVTAQEILKNHDIPVVFLSSHIEKEIVEKTEKITSYGYVVKNTGITILDASIKMAFKLHHSHAVIEDQKQSLQAANEELQATIEELEATNEEFEVVNEQLLQSEQELLSREETLRHSHELMNYVITHNRSAVAIHDRDLKYIYVSQRYLDEYKIKEMDVIGKHHYDVFPDLPQKWRDVHLRALAGEISSAEDDPYVREDGSVEWTRWECRPWYEADGTIGGIIVYTEVTTERKQMEDALRESNSLLSSILESTGDGILVVNFEGMIVKYNQRFLEMLRIPGHLAEMRDDTRLIEYVQNHLKDPDGFLSKIMELYDTPGAISADELAFQDGRVFERYSQPHLIGNVVMGRVWSFHDITERKHFEKALLKSETRFDRLSEQNRTMIWEIDPQGTYIYINSVAEQVIGYRPDELIGKKRYYDICPKNNRLKLKTEASGIFQERKPFAGMENPITTKDGQIVWVSTSGLPLFNDDGEVCGYWGSDIDITERKNVEVELRNSEERFRVFFDRSMVGMAITAPNGRLIRINCAFSDIVGYSMEELHEMNFISITHPDDIALSQEGARCLLAGEQESFRFEKRYITKAGGTVWTDVSIVLIRNSAGAPLNFITSIIDITKRKESDEILREASLLNRQIINSAHEGIIVYDKDLRYRVWNPFMELLSGMKADDVIGKHPAEVFPFLKSAGVIERLDQALMGDIPPAVEFPFDINGNSGWNIDTSVPLRSVHGEVIGVIATVQDISGRKLIEETLRESNDKLKALISYSPCAIIALNIDGIVTVWNPMAEQIFGWNEDEVVGHSLPYLPDGKTSEHQGMREMVLRDRIFLNKEVQRKKKDGTIVDVSISAATLYNSQGQAIGIMSVLADNSERKIAEKRINNLLKEKDLILREVHHRIKNNMSTVIGLLTMQAEMKGNEMVHDIFMNAVGRVMSMMVLYDKLYRSDIGSTLPMDEYLSTLIEEITGIFPNKDMVDVKVSISNKILSSEVLSPLGIIINELITNSMKYAFEGRTHGIIIISASVKKGIMSLVIEDDGIGIPQSVSIENPDGLGLLLVSTLVEQINGSISIVGGHGTKFIIEFPV